jgi:hypothetical protein
MFSKIWWLSTLERFAKTFVQGYMAFWLLSAGLTDSSAEANAAAFDLLFTWNNVKAGVVTSALSLAMSFASTPFGPDGDSPSLVVTETKPTQPAIDG